MVEYALILALVALIVIVALIATGGQIINLYSNIIQTRCATTTQAAEDRLVSER